MLKRLIRRFRLWLRLRQKAHIISRAEERIGGPSARVSRRGDRLEKIRREKRAVIGDLVRSWRIGEIKPPREQDLATIEHLLHKISWQRLLEIKKRYWEENIYDMPNYPR